MKLQGQAFRIVSKRDCLQYLEQHGKKLADNNWDYSIPSRAGFVYTLSSGEFVVVPGTSNESYPCFIIKDEQQFLKFVEEDFFPVGNENMTWLELHALEIKNLSSDVTVFNPIVAAELKSNPPFMTIEDIRNGFENLQIYLKKSRQNKQDKLGVINSFGISVMEYLMRTKNYRLELQKEYEIYNPYYYPMVIFDGRKMDVIAKLHIALQSESKAAFDLFSKFVNL